MRSGAREREEEFGRRLYTERQVRVRIVDLARAYRTAIDGYERAGMDVEIGEGDVVTMARAGEAMDAARDALFSALEELDMLEEEGP